ncbi:MAG: carbohydrate kinase [Paludibacter sp.]
MDKISVGIGEILWDVFSHGKVLGGAPANFAYMASQFGLTGYVLSAVGDDMYGDEILQMLEEKELKFLINRTKQPTGTVQVTVDAEGIPKYNIQENVAWDNILFTAEMENLARKTCTVCFGSLAQRSRISRNNINRFLDFVPDDAFRIFDINLRQHYYSFELIDSSLQRCNVLKINDEELAVVTELFDWKNKTEIEAAKLLLVNYNLKIVILTKGIHGSYVITNDEVLFKYTPRIIVTDTVGAGDSFTAAFVSALLKGKSISEAHQLAIDISAFVCTQRGAMPLLPDNMVINE